METRPILFEDWEQVAVATQSQALNAVVFFFREFLMRDHRSGIIRRHHVLDVVTGLRSDSGKNN